MLSTRARPQRETQPVHRFAHVDIEIRVAIRHPQMNTCTEYWAREKCQMACGRRIFGAPLVNKPVYGFSWSEGAILCHRNRVFFVQLLKRLLYSFSSDTFVNGTSTTLLVPSHAVSSSVLARRLFILRYSTSTSIHVKTKQCRQALAGMWLGRAAYSPLQKSLRTVGVSLEKGSVRCTPHMLLGVSFRGAVECDVPCATRARRYRRNVREK